MKYTHVVTVEIVTEERVSEKVSALAEAWLQNGVATEAFESARAVSARRQIFRLGKPPKNAVDPMEIRAERDRKLGVAPLGEALCDDCSLVAYTRWYADAGTKRESVAATLCEAHNTAFLRRNARERKRLNLEQTSQRRGGAT